MTPVTAGKVKYGVWGLICGAIIAMIIGFAWAGWSTEGTTLRRGEEAVVAARAAICVAQFMKDPNHQEHLQAIGKLSPFDQATFIEKGGWHKMPGEDTASSTVTRACARGLDVLMKQ